MQKKSFSNVVIARAAQKDVWQALVEPQYLLEWVPEIMIARQSENRISITRTSPSINQHEIVSIEEITNGIKYTSTEGRIEYEVVFLISGVDKCVIIQEDVYVLEKTALHLPLKLLTPIAKHAFAVNLNNLVTVVEKRTRLAK